MRYLLAALLGLYTMTLATPSFAADCTCDHKCSENCAAGKGEECKCEACDCAKTGHCKHGKCEHKEGADHKHEGTKKEKKK